MDGVSIAVDVVPDWGTFTEPVRFLPAVVEGDTALVDLEDVTAVSLGGDPRFGGPTVSPAQRWVLASNEGTEDGLMVVTVSALPNPSDPIWSYEAPGGMVFVDVGRFTGDDEVLLQLRTLATPVQLLTYGGVVGEALELVDDPDFGVWERSLGDLVESAERDSAVVRTSDGVSFTVNDENHLGCATGPAISIVGEDEVRFVDRRGSQTTTVRLARPGPVGLSALRPQHVHLDRFNVHLAPASEERAILVVDCELLTVSDMTAEFMQDGDSFLVPSEAQASLSGTVAAIPARVADDRYLIIVDSNGARIEALGPQPPARIMLSPSGERVALVFDTGTGARIQVRALDSFATEAEQDFDFDANTAWLVWVPHTETTD
ncbi:MAG: hypothetical protein AAGA65_21545 [Actinomycetota bacterium]